ncbi:hypothetical protein OEZ86_004636 [Tetradesmus obliquus]|nr:hypothetical protein OEZ86_004636 [Tetradesmus obliquus]
MAATVAVNEDEAVQLLASGRHIPMQLDNTAAGQLQQRIAECLQAAKGAIAAAQQKCTAGQAVYIKLAGAKTATGICTARYQKPGTGVHDHRPRTRPRKANTEADKLMKKANKYWQPSLMDFRLKPDWEAAAPLFEKAALLYKQVGQSEKARAAYERAAQSQEKIGSVWHAAKHLETCGAISKDLGQYEQMAEFYRQAGSYFAQAGRISAAADALARGAKALEDKAPTEASALYGEALEHYESDGKEAQATDVFRQAIALLVKQQAWSDAVSMCMRFGEACDKANARSSQSKAYLGAIVVWLFAGNGQQAWQVFQDVLGIEAFTKSDEAFAADALFLAYQSGSAEKVQAVVQAKQSFKQLDNQLARLAVKLPQGDLAGQARVLAAVQGGRDPNKTQEQQEEEELL